jgi:hypothetical protein
MKNITNKNELISQIEANNYYYRDNNFDDYATLEKSTNEFFKSITADYDDVDEYYVKFGGVSIERVGVEKFYNEEGNTTFTVNFYEGWIDSGVPAEDYFYGYIILEN